MEPILPEIKHWYTRWWGMLILLAGFVCLIFFSLVVITTIRYWWQIKNGIQPVFIQDHYNRFTSLNVSQQAKKVVDRTELETADDPYLGRPGAPLTIVAFVDYKCPNSKAAAAIMKQLMQKYGYTVKYIVREFPGETLYPGSTKLSEIASCAYRQNKFWEMHDLLFYLQSEIPETLTDVDIENLAIQSGVNYPELKECLGGEISIREPKQDYLDGVRFGVEGTPTFFVNGDRVEGVVPYDAWQSYINEIVKKNSK